jgi:hypothetical protein
MPMIPPNAKIAMAKQPVRKFEKDVTIIETNKELAAITKAI